MSTEKTIVGIIPGLQATALLGENLKEMNYSLNPRRRMKKKRRSGSMMRMGIKNLIGIPMIGATANLANQIS